MSPFPPPSKIQLGCIDQERWRGSRPLALDLLVASPTGQRTPDDGEENTTAAAGQTPSVVDAIPYLQRWRWIGSFPCSVYGNGARRERGIQKSWTNIRFHASCHATTLRRPNSRGTCRRSRFVKCKVPGGKIQIYVMDNDRVT